MIRDTLTAMGVDKSKIHFELFIAGLNGKTQRSEGTVPLKPVFRSPLDGNTFEFPLASSSDTILGGRKVAPACPSPAKAAYAAPAAPNCWKEKSKWTSGRPRTGGGRGGAIPHPSLTENG